MALPLKSGADLYNQQAIRMRLHNLGADPLSDFGAGQIYFNTSTDSDTAKRVRLYDGTSFRSLAFYDEIADNEEFNALVGRVGTLETMLNTQDAEGVINTWNEIQTFLDSVQEGTDLMDLLNSKFDKSGGTIEGDSVYLLSLNNISEGATTIGMQLKVNGTTKGLLLAGEDWGVAILNPTNSTYALGIKDDNTPYFGTSSTKYTLLHSGNYSDQIGDYYLKTSGGILTSSSVPLTIDRTNGYSTIAYNCDGGMVGVLGFSTDGTLIVSPNRATNTQYFNVLHSGNCTSYYAGGLAHSNGTVGAIVNSSGNVTIGSQDLATSDNGNPKLYVQGTALVRDKLSFNTNTAHCLCCGALASSSLSSTDIFYSATKHVFYGGNVLIGATEDNGAKLQVNGDVKIHNGVAKSYSYIRSGNYSSNTARLSIGTCYGYNTEIEAVSIYNGKVGIGASMPSEKLHVVGNLLVEGNIVATGEVSAGGAGEEGSGSGGGASVHQEVFTPSTTTVGINHNLGTEDVVITLYEKDSSSNRWSVCLTDIEIVDTNNIEITFGSTSSVQHKVVVMGGAA